MSTALLLVDIQNDYFPGGNMELDGMDRAAANAAAALARFRERSRPAIHVQHLSLQPGATFFVPGSEGAEIHASVSPRGEERVLRKHFPNAFRETPLLDELRAAGIDGLVIAGAMSHMCIDATTRAAADLGLRCSVVHDACATRALRFGEATIPAGQVHGSFMSALGAGYAKVVSLTELLADVR